jgi:hypothetical protein
MNGSKDKPRSDDTPVTGRSSGFRVRIHPAFEGTGSGDPLSDRLLTLLRMHPNVVKFRADDLSGMDVTTKQELLAQLIEVLDLDAPAKDTIPL